MTAELEAPAKQVVGQEIMVKLSDIDDDWKHNTSRQYVNEEHAKRSLEAERESDGYRSFVRTIKEKGLISALIVRPMKGADKPYRLVAGFHRMMALRDLKMEQAPVKVLDIDAQTADELNVIENVERKSISTFQLASAAVSYYRKHKKADGKKYESAEVGKRIGKSGDYVRGLVMCREKLPEEILLAWADRDEGKNYALFKATGYPNLLTYAALSKEDEKLAAFHLNVKMAEGLSEEEAKKFLTEHGYTPPNAGTGRGAKQGSPGIKRKDVDAFAKVVRKLKASMNVKDSDRADGALAALDFLLGKKKRWAIGVDVLFDPAAEEKDKRAAENAK